MDRVASFGFIASEEVMNEGATNLGLKDLRLALEWVKANMHAFGGGKMDSRERFLSSDCERITIWGESAGTYSVGLQILAYGGRKSGLFHRAILESGTPLATYRESVLKST